MKQTKHTSPPLSTRPEAIGFSFQEDLWFGDFDDEAARDAAASSMAAMAGRIMGARPFPAAAQKLVQLTRNENTNIMKVVRVLESDPGLSQRVLRLVNSAGYGLRVRCTSLNHATALLGQQRLQQIATSAVLLNHFGRTSDETKRKQEHGALVASLCRYLAIHLGLPQEDLFTCGLLHDLGQLMMLDEGEHGYRELVLEHEGQWDTLHIAEREVLGFDHAVLAAHVLASWSIPAPVPEVIALHHQPALAHHRGPKISAMVQTLRFADHMAHLLETSNQKEGPILLAECEAASYLGFSEMQISSMWNDLKQLHQANLSRRMDIADIAPRSVSVPASLAPRAISITDAPTGFTDAPPPSIQLTQTRAVVSLSPGTVPMLDALPQDSLGFSYSERMILAQATPILTASNPQIDLGLDDATNTEGSHDSERPSEIGNSPKIFPCALCYGPTFGARCPVCAAHVCATHQTEGEQWCIACDEEFRFFRAKHRVPELFKIASIATVSIALPTIYLFLGMHSALGTIGMFLTFSLAAYAAQQGFLKARFKRQRAEEAMIPSAPQTTFQTDTESVEGPQNASEYARNLLEQELESQIEREHRKNVQRETSKDDTNDSHAEAPTMSSLRPQVTPSNQYSWPPSQQGGGSIRPAASLLSDAELGAALPAPPASLVPLPSSVAAVAASLLSPALQLEPTSQHSAIAPPAPDEFAAASSRSAQLAHNDNQLTQIASKTSADEYTEAHPPSNSDAMTAEFIQSTGRTQSIGQSCSPLSRSPDSQEGNELEHVHSTRVDEQVDVNDNHVTERSLDTAEERSLSDSIALPPVSVESPSDPELVADESATSVETAGHSIPANASIGSDQAEPNSSRNRARRRVSRPAMQSPPPSEKTARISVVPLPDALPAATSKRVPAIPEKLHESLLYSKNYQPEKNISLSEDELNDWANAGSYRESEPRIQPQPAPPKVSRKARPRRPRSDVIANTTEAGPESSARSTAPAIESSSSIPVNAEAQPAPDIHRGKTTTASLAPPLCDPPTQTVAITPPSLPLEAFCSNEGAQLIRIVSLPDLSKLGSNSAENDHDRKVSGE